MSDDILFTPFTLKGLTLPNRIVMAPMTRSMAVGGIPGPANAEYYRRRAEGGVGMILTEGTVVNRPASRNIPDVPFFHGEVALAGWAEVAKAVHAAGSHHDAAGRTKGSEQSPPEIINPRSGTHGRDKLPPRETNHFTKMWIRTHA